MTQPAHAATPRNGHSLPRTLLLLSFSFLLLLLPNSALAAEGEHVRLAFGGLDQTLLWIALVLALVAIGAALFLIQTVRRVDAGPASMQEVSEAIKDGAIAYLQKQIRVMATFAIVPILGLAALYWKAGPAVAGGVAVAFIFGVLGSYLAGYVGMVMAVTGNCRVANAAQTSYRSALSVAFRSGSVAGLLTVGIGLFGASLILLIGGEYAVRYLVGFGFGGSLAALFMRVGGGIFTKAADVGADLVGKKNLGLPEDDARNPAVIADNVGDNVGDCAGMAADVFESYAVTLISAIVLAAATASVFPADLWTRLVSFTLLTAGIGVLASLIGIFTMNGADDPAKVPPLESIRRSFMLSALAALSGTAAASYFFLGGANKPFVAGDLVSLTEYTQREARTLQAARETLAKRSFDTAAINKAIADTATRESRAPEEVTAAQVLQDRETLPEAIREVPSAVIARAIAKRSDSVKSYEITASDLLAQKAVKDLGYSPTDEFFVQRALAADVAGQPRPLALEGYRRITDPEDPSVPALGYATYATTTSPNAAPALSTIGKEYMGTGKDQLVLKQVRIQNELPGAPGPDGKPRPPIKVDETRWIGPDKLGDFEDQIKRYRTDYVRQNPKAKLDDLQTVPVDLYVGPSGRLAFGVPDIVERPQSIQATVQYFRADPKTVEEAQQQAAPGAAPAVPPTESVEVVVVKNKLAHWWQFALCFAIGLGLALLIEKLTDYYVSTDRRPTREVSAESANGGAATMIIKGFAYAAESSAAMVMVLVAALLCPLFIFPPSVYGGYELALFGIAMVGLGLLANTGYVLAMDTFGPISDNAQGVYEMSHTSRVNQKGLEVVNLLDAAGNTTKALTKGFAIATAVVAAIALFNSYRTEAGLILDGLRLDVPEIFLGLLIGGAAPFLFIAFSINAVGRSASRLITEVERQVTEQPGILTGEVKPNYGRCVALVTESAQRELIGPGVLAIALPIAVGFGFSIGRAPVEINGVPLVLTGAQALGGYLAGAILSGQLMAILLANSGGIWDNAKKLVEEGEHGGKGSEAHKASIICDTVGDPFKDTAGPALNPLIKVMNLVALLVAGVIIQPQPLGVQVTITAACLIALALAIWQSKRDYA
jgi:K(+)-stimulated pyrophosphate-energized sodium pump